MIGPRKVLGLELEGLQLAAEGKRSTRGMGESQPCQSSDVHSMSS